MKRKLYIVLCGILASIACTLLVAFVFIPARPGVTKGNFDRIKLGMTKAEVAAILGKPKFSEPERRSDLWCELWQHPNLGHACEVFYLNDGVESMHWTDSKETVSEWLLRWSYRVWRRPHERGIE